MLTFDLLRKSIEQGAKHVFDTRFMETRVYNLKNSFIRSKLKYIQCPVSRR